MTGLAQPILDFGEAWPLAPLVPGGYGAILADPPWRFLNRSVAGEAKNPVAHYACMTIEQLAALPVARLAAPDCALLTWATAPLLHRAIALVEAWGFTFKTAGAWAKQSSTGQRWAFGTGYVLRSAAEFYLVATIGKPRVRSRSVRNLVVAPVREHSRKPDQLHADIESLYAGPYAELFARQRRPGWDACSRTMVPRKWLATLASPRRASSRSSKPSTSSHSGSHCSSLDQT